MLQADEKKKETMEIGESAGDMAILGVDAPPHRVVAEAPSLVGILYKSVAEKLFEELPGDKATFEETVFTKELSLMTIEAELVENLTGILGNTPPEAFTAFVLHAFEQKLFKSGDVLVKEGDQADALFMIIYGGADVDV